MYRYLAVVVQKPFQLVSQLIINAFLMLEEAYVTFAFLFSRQLCSFTFML